MLGLHLLNSVLLYQVVKTITVKADDRFDAMLSKLAKTLKTTKSGVIRAAVLGYEKQVKREALGRRIREASLRTRVEATRSASDFDAANADGL